MKNKLLALFFIITIAFANIAEAKFTITDSVNSSVMAEIKNWADKDTMVFIDLDDTLIMPKSSMFLYNTNPYRNFIASMIARGKEDNKYNIAIAKWYEKRQIKLVENDWIEYIQALQAKGAKVYGLCSMPIHLLNIEEKRYLETKNLNIIFTNNINNKEILTVDKKRNWEAIFYKGIIFTADDLRSNTLMNFLKVTTNVPKKMVFISTVKYELQKVDKMLRSFNMEFYNVLYLGIKKILGKPDPALVQFQQNELINNGRWLEDDAAKAELKK